MSKIQMGQTASVSKSFSEQEVNMFANLSLDFNPVHLDPEFAKTTVFGKQIVHGMLVSSLFSGLLGKHLPGEGTIYLGQDLKFKKPVYIDQKVTASVEVINIREDKPIITLSTICKNDSGEVVISGQAIVIFEEK
jgi:acyl dehydratase